MASNRKQKKTKGPPLSLVTKPPHLSLEEWQLEIRRRTAQEEKFRVKNIGAEPIFSSYHLLNPKTKGNYRVEIRGEKLGLNFCSCPDFSINTLGTCKHIEFLLRQIRRRIANRELLKEGSISKHSSVTLRYGLKRQIAFSFGREASASLKNLITRYFDAENFLTPWGFDHFGEFVEKVKELEDEVRFHEDGLSFIAQVRDVKLRRWEVDKKFPGGSRSPHFKDLVRTELYPYQKEGALFAAKAGRCLIADEMGLGKTVQAVAAAEIMSKCFGVEKVLIICPTTLKVQWKREIEKFTQRKAQVIQGLLTNRYRQYEEQSFFKITNYDVIHRDGEVIKNWAPDLIILDEAQRIKNWKTRLARSVKKLSSPYAIVLTGTPLENRLEELHSIVEFIDRHHLGPLFRFLDRHQITDENGRVVGYQKLNDLGDSLKQILIRRKKSEVFTQLSERTDKNYFVPMTQEQLKIHQENGDTVARIVAKWKRFKFISEEDRQILMIALQNMRMVSDNTYLIDQRKVFGSKVAELGTLLGEILEYKDVKVVIFSQWIRMFELITTMLQGKKLKFVWLHGGVPGNKRGELIEKFHEDPNCRIFLSTEAGGVGLNLQCVSVVINMDLPWNPAVLEQRIGRVHRIGQKNRVQVFNFISQNSIEHGILSLLGFKKSMFSGVLDQGENKILLETSRFNLFMKTVETATGSVEKQDGNMAAEMKEAKIDAATAQEVTAEEGEASEPAGGDGKNGKMISEDSSQGIQVFKGLLQQGASLLSQFSQALGNAGNECLKSSPPSGNSFKIVSEKESGQQFLQLPLPNKDVLEKIVQAGNLLLQSLR